MTSSKKLFIKKKKKQQEASEGDLITALQHTVTRRQKNRYIYQQKHSTYQLRLWHVQFTKKVLYKFIDMVQQVNFGSAGMSTRLLSDMSIITSEIREAKRLVHTVLFL